METIITIITITITTEPHRREVHTGDASFELHGSGPTASLSVSVSAFTFTSRLALSAYLDSL